MKVIIIIEKYGGNCNRFFQSLHYHAFSIENNIYFLNLSMIGLLKFDNDFYYFFDHLNNFFLSVFSRFLKYLFRNNQICFSINGKNYLKIVNGWDFREIDLTQKHHKKLKEIYTFKKKNLSKKAKSIVNYLQKLKKEGKYLVGLHIRRKDYKLWNNGKYFFNDKFYKTVIKNIRLNLVLKNEEPFIIVVSDEEINSKIGFDLYLNGTWKEDQITLQYCDLILGPPSTFSMWASYISQIPLIKLHSDQIKDFNEGIICKG